MRGVGGMERHVLEGDRAAFGVVEGDGAAAAAADLVAGPPAGEVGAVPGQGLGQRGEGRVAGPAGGGAELGAMSPVSRSQAGPSRRPALGVCLFGLIFYGTGGPVPSAFRITIATLPATALATALIARRLTDGDHSRPNRSRKRIYAHLISLCKLV